MKHILFAAALVLAQWSYGQDTNLKAVNATLDAWHNAAAQADYKTYTGLMTTDVVFIGTDPTENWRGKDFLAFAKPHFDAGNAWTMKPLERHVFFDETFKTAWFDELLDTSMKICRGSGVLLKQKDGSWKIAQYVLSITIPNDNVKSVIAGKSAFDDRIINGLGQKK